VLVEHQIGDGTLIVKSNGILRRRAIRALWEILRRESVGSEKISFRK